jgi:tRNA (guanine-N7-)-methyltransferase
MKLQDVVLPEVITKYRHQELDEIREWAAKVDFKPPIHVEIGSNRGRFLLELAKNNAGCTVLGIEIRKKFAQELQSVIRDRRLDNAFALGADALVALPLLFEDASLESVYLLFPDPWWKMRHAKRRLFTLEFLDLVADKLRVGGQLVVKTDVQPYAEFIENTLATTPRFDAGTPLTTLPDTSRERKVKRKSGEIWEYFLTRNSAPRSAAREEPTALPHFGKTGTDLDGTDAPARRPRHRG